MNALHDGTQTSGLKGHSYDWQALLVPTEPDFSKELKDLMDDDSVAAES